MNWFFDFMAARSQFELIVVMICCIFSPVVYIPVIFSIDRWVPPTVRFFRRLAGSFWDSFYYWHIGDRSNDPR